MSTSETAADQAVVRASNIGGIDETDVTLHPGVTVLEGRNATNRTSFLQAIMAALGSDRASLKADADEGHVELQLGDETYTRTLARTPDGVVATGDPYVDDPELVDLFAFLLESNEARLAVERGDDLRELIMRPVDTEAITAEIQRLRNRKDELDAEIDALEDQRDRLPELEQEQHRLEEKLTETREELEAVEDEIDEADADLEESRRKESAFQDALDDLREARGDLEDTRFELETERETLAELRADREELAEELAELSDAPMGELEELEAELERLRAERETVESDLSDLQTVVQFNESMLADGGTTLLDDAEDGGDLTDQLVSDDEVTCWTCGTTVEDDRIEETVNRLRELRQYKVQESDELKSRIEDLVSERESLQAQQRRRNGLERDLERTEDEIERREARLEELDETKAELEDRVEELEDAAAEEGTAEYSDLVDLHKEANQLEFEVGRIESDLNDVQDEIASVEDELGREDGLRDEREDVASELGELRTRVEDIERDAVDAFNDHMETILDVLGYENLERIWIERTQKTVRQGRRREQQSAFELHVVRDGDSGVYEDTVDHLSESEREVTGLVFALAGFLVHDVHEQVPFMVLDSLEAIDSERIAALVEYFSDYVDYFAVALLPEDAQALHDDYHYVTEI